MIGSKVSGPLTTTTIANDTSTTTTFPSTTTTINGGGTTTTTSTAATASTGSGYLIAVNIRGEDTSATESSGTLPGTSPSMVEPGMLRSLSGRPIPLMYDRAPEPPDPVALQETLRILDRRQRLYGAQQFNIFSVGSQKNFWVNDDNDRVWREVSATCRAEGTYGYIFVDDSLTAVPDAALQSYAAEFDVMYQVLADNLGTFTDRDGNGKVTILLYNFNDGGSVNGYMGGYFWSKDYLEDSVTWQQARLRSNEMDIIYIRGNQPAGCEQVGEDFYDYNLTTLVHEYQHLVHFGLKVWAPQNPQGHTDTWIDEMMAMASETMYFKQKIQEDPAYFHPSMLAGGYLQDRIEFYTIDSRNSIRNGHGLTCWDRNGDVFANYCLSYLFGQYLALQSANGQAIFKTIMDYMIANNSHDFQAVAAAVTRNIGVGSWEDLLKNFAIANLAQQPGGLFGYKGAFSLQAKGPTGNTARINNSGAVYRAAASWTKPANSGPNIRFYDISGALISDGTYTTSVPGSGSTGRCPSAELLGEESNATRRLQTFRDEVLAGSPAGQMLIDLYYRHAGEMSLILDRRPLVRLQTLQALARLMPLIEEAVAGYGLQISPELEDELLALSDLYRQHASEEFQRTINRLQRRLTGEELQQQLQP